MSENSQSKSNLPLIILTLMFTGVAAYVLLWATSPKLPKADDEIEAAIMIDENIRNSVFETDVEFTDDVEIDDIFMSLEAISPYALNVNFRYLNNRYEITVDSPFLEEQVESVKEAEQIAKSLVTDDMTIIQRMETIHDYIVMRTEYDEKNVDMLTGDSESLMVNGMVNDGIAVCAGYSRAFVAMCNAVGVDVIYITDAEMNHGWNALMYKGQMYYIDLTYDDPIPDKVGRALRDYFMISETEFRRTHNWDFDKYKILTHNFYSPDLEYIQNLQDLKILGFDINNKNAEDAVSFELLTETTEKALEIIPEIPQKEEYTEIEVGQYIGFTGEMSDEICTNGDFARMIYEIIK